MGTTLTGTTPQDTYDSLIKVTDNGPLSGSLKTLTDGLGNDSALALSTGAASITGSLTTTAKTLAERVQVGTAASLNDATGVGNTLQFANYSPSAFVTGSADSYIYKNSTVFGGLAAQSLVFQTRSDTTGGGFAFVAGGTPAVVATITGAGNVGIGTSSPDTPLTIQSASANAKGLKLIGRAADNISILGFNNNANSSEYGYVAGIPTEFRINSGSGLPITFTNLDTERVRILAAGGLTFNGDTAQANALDDYEEGTWTPTDASGAGLTLTTAVGSYTKIGREVFYRAFIQYPSTVDVNNATLGGLPFTVANINSARSGNVTYTDEATLVYAFSTNNTTSVGLYTNVGGFVSNATMSGNLVFIVGNYYV